MLQHGQKITASLLFDIGSGNKRRLLDIKKIADNYGQVQCEALLSLHAFTGSDATSSFRGVGKVKPMKILLKDKKYISVFASLGNIWQEREELDRELEDFTCTIFGYSRIKSVDLLRYTILKKKCDDKDQIDPKKKH